MFRAAVIGCGKIGSEFADDPHVKDIYTHAGAYMACPDTELVGVCDTNKEKAQICKDKWGLSGFYTNYHDMVSETKTDIVSICTPDSTHYEIIKSLLSTTEIKAIFAEKPLALSANQAEELVTLAERKGVLLTVNYSRRFTPRFSEIKKILHSPTFGTIQAINGYYTKGTFHNGTHWFDLARFLIGEIHKVQGIDVRNEKNDDPTLDAILDFSNGCRGYLHGCDTTKFSIFEMDILGSNGRIAMKESGHIIEIYSVTKSRYYSGYNSLTLCETYNDAMKNVLLYAVEDIVRCLITGRRSLCSGYDGLSAIKIAHAVSKSAETGIPTKID